MTSTSFRDSMNSLGWSRRDADLPVNTSASNPLLSRLQSINPFNRGGYVSLPTDEGPGAPLPAPTRREEEEGFFARKSGFYFHTLELCNTSSSRPLLLHVESLPARLLGKPKAELLDPHTNFMQFCIILNSSALQGSIALRIITVKQASLPSFGHVLSVPQRVRVCGFGTMRAKESTRSASRSPVLDSQSFIYFAIRANCDVQ